MTLPIALDIASLHTAYQQGELTPAALIDDLLAQAEAHGKEPACYHRWQPGVCLCTYGKRFCGAAVD